MRIAGDINIESYDLGRIKVDDVISNWAIPFKLDPIKTVECINRIQAKDYPKNLSF